MQQGLHSWAYLAVATNMNTSRLPVRSYRGVIFQNRADGICAGFREPFLVGDCCRKALGVTDDALRVFEILLAIPPDLHDAVEARIMNTSSSNDKPPLSCLNGTRPDL